MRLFSLMVGFLLLGVAGIFAADGSTTAGLPTWLAGLLALLGLGSTGTIGITLGIKAKAKQLIEEAASHVKIVEDLKGIFQKGKDFMTAGIVFGAQAKAIIANSELVPEWNIFINDGIAFVSSVKFMGIDGKAKLLQKLLIDKPIVLPAIPASVETVIKKVEAVAEKVDAVVEAIPTAPVA